MPEVMARMLGFVLILLAVILAPVSSAARGDTPKADKTLSPYFLVETPDSTLESFPLESTRVFSRYTASPSASHAGCSGKNHWLRSCPSSCKATRGTPPSAPGLNAIVRSPSLRVSATPTVIPVVPE